eukprot:5788029-Amphidinium_carterae.1
MSRQSHPCGLDKFQQTPARRLLQLSRRTKDCQAPCSKRLLRLLVGSLAKALGLCLLNCSCLSRLGIMQWQVGARRGALSVSMVQRRSAKVLLACTVKPQFNVTSIVTSERLLLEYSRCHACWRSLGLQGNLEMNGQMGTMSWIYLRRLRARWRLSLESATALCVAQVAFTFQGMRAGVSELVPKLRSTWLRPPAWMRLNSVQDASRPKRT